MPVSLCEWRVRIGRFVQWIKEYEVRDQKEKLLRERTRLLKVLTDRLLAKKTASESDDNECDGKQNDGSTDNESIIKDNSTTTESTIKEKNTPTESTIKENNTTTESSIKENNTTTESTIKENNTTTESTTTENNTTTESTIKDNNITTESTNKENNTTTESTIKDNNITTESTIKENNTTSESTNKENNTTTESTIKENNITTESTIKENNTTSESTIKKNNTLTKTTIIDNSTTSKSSNKENSPTLSTIKEMNTTTESTINESNTKHNSTITENNTKTGSTIKNNISTKYTIKENKVITESTITNNNNPSASIVQKTNNISRLLACDGDVETINTTCPELLLIQAGDVETNPGPIETTIGVLQERELLKLADDVSGEFYYKLCIGLGFKQAMGKNILTMHHLDVSASVLDLLCTWKMKQRDGTDCRRDLSEILRRENLDELACKISEGTYYQQDKTSAATSGDGTQPLTKEEVARCGEDFKTFYRTRLCKIKTDPLDFNSILEFERIYTNLVLLRSEMGTTTKTHLDYSELLTTKINEELPKRLMVEGEGGAGKTTFCSKIAWDWAKGATEFIKFDWVLVIPLRDTKHNEKLSDYIARTCLSDSNPVQPWQIDKYILDNPSKVFIIFDGLDEYDGDLVKKTSDISKIIRSEKFKECTVMVTTRQWKADQIRSNHANDVFMKTYAFIEVTGFNEEHVSTYINKYFKDNEQTGRELIRLIEDNDVIKENMAPFPLFIAMLCVLWKDSDSDKRNMIRKLKTFSQLFTTMIIYLKGHFERKQCHNSFGKIISNEEIDLCLLKIGKFAFSGVLEKKLTYTTQDFSGYEEAMEACCRIGVLNKENNIVPLKERSVIGTPFVTRNVFFPHKLFQEYLAGLYLSSLFKTDHREYEKAVADVVQRHASEFRYLMYFVASQNNEIGLDITKKLINLRTSIDFQVDVAFEAHHEEVRKEVGQHIFAEQKSLEIGDDMSAHTVSGYLFIMEKKTMETLVINRRSCGSTVSRDLADVICSSKTLTALELKSTALHGDFYSVLADKIKASKVQRLSIKWMDITDEPTARDLAKFLNMLPNLNDLTLKGNNIHSCFYTELAAETVTVEVPKACTSVCRLHIDHQVLNEMEHDGFTLKRIFSNLEQLFFSTLQTVSPNIIRSLAHSGLKELSFNIADDVGYGDLRDDEECHVSLIGDATSLDQAFLNSFPQLTNLTFTGLVIGNNRCQTILQSLRQHQQLKEIGVVHCYTDEELDPIASAINMANRLNVNLQHEQTQKHLECLQMSSALVDALCHRTSIQELILTNKTKFTNIMFSEESGRTIDSKIEKLYIADCNLDRNDPTASRDLARFLCFLPCLTDLTIQYSWLHGDFYHEIARLASSSKIEKLNIEYCYLESNVPTASSDLARFLCCMPCLTDLAISYSWIHDEFYHEIARLASSSKIQQLNLEDCNLDKNDPTASRDLARFLCFLPCLTDLTIQYQWLHGDFYHEIARLASSSKNPFFTNNMSWKKWHNEHRGSQLIPLETTTTTANLPIHTPPESQVEKTDEQLSSEAQTNVQSQQHQSEVLQETRQYRDSDLSFDQSHTQGYKFSPGQGLQESSWYQQQSTQDHRQIVIPSSDAQLSFSQQSTQPYQEVPSQVESSIPQGQTRQQMGLHIASNIPVQPSQGHGHQMIYSNTEFPNTQPYHEQYVPQRTDPQRRDSVTRQPLQLSLYRQHHIETQPYTSHYILPHETNLSFQPLHEEQRPVACQSQDVIRSPMHQHQQQMSQAQSRTMYGQNNQPSRSQQFHGHYRQSQMHFPQYNTQLREHPRPSMHQSSHEQQQRTVHPNQTMPPPLNFVRQQTPSQSTMPTGMSSSPGHEYYDRPRIQYQTHHFHYSDNPPQYTPNAPFHPTNVSNPNYYTPSGHSHPSNLQNPNLYTPSAHKHPHPTDSLNPNYYTPSRHSHPFTPHNLLRTSRGQQYQAYPANLHVHTPSGQQLSGGHPNIYPNPGQVPNDPLPRQQYPRLTKR